MLAAILDQFSMVWLELALAIFAALLYSIMSGKQTKRGNNAKLTISADPIVEAKSDPAPPTPEELAAGALALGNITEAIMMIKELPETNAGSVPPNIATRLLRVVANSQRIDDMLPQLMLLKGKITAGPLETVVTAAATNKELSACRQLHMISSKLFIPKSQQTFRAFAKAYFADVAALRALIEEVHVAAFRTPLPLSFGQIVLDASITMKEWSLGMEIIEKVSNTDAMHLRKVLEQAMQSPSNACSSGDKKTKSCLNTGSAQSSSGENSLRAGVSENAGSPREGDLHSKVPSTQNDAVHRANDIRSCGKNGDLNGALRIFERLGDQRDNLLMINSILEACVECKNIDKAFEYFDQARHKNLADVVSYNTMIKGCLANGQESTAKSLLVEIGQRGLTPTRASYHGLLNARVNARDLPAAWRLVSDMQASGISPNAVTCSILLKGKFNSAQEVSRVLALIDAMEESMDEVLFLSVVDACIRTGRLDALSRQMGKFMKQSSASGLTAPTYGSMIKAYGHARDVKRVWDLWNQMISHNVIPTSVTMGCMVEALVANGCTDDAWKLTQTVRSDASTKDVVNTVIYSSILKGFANAQQTDKVMALYEDMRSQDIQPNTITFNTILNAFAKNGAMHRVPALLEDMATASPPVELDIVSYSTIVKGYCNSGNLDRALKVVNDMKEKGKHVPDEVMYNSLLGGCAKEHRPDEAIALLSDMRKFGVPPSNYTLSMLVKLMGRCRRINQAFTMLEDISKEYGLKINIQVYTCLIQGCFNSGQAQKAVALHEKIIEEGLIPDAMTYTVLVRGCIQSGLIDQAVYLVQYAHGKAFGQSDHAAAPGLNAGCIDELVAILSSKGDHQAKTHLVDLAECRVAPMRSNVAQPPRRNSNY
jgi:pentatricopeptide repeat protein